MNKKQNYTVPEVEVVKLSPRSGVLTTFSGDGQGGANANAMKNDTETFGTDW